jgi:hypothetical protein
MIRQWLDRLGYAQTVWAVLTSGAIVSTIALALSWARQAPADILFVVVVAAFVTGAFVPSAIKQLVTVLRQMTGRDVRVELPGESPDTPDTFHANSGYWHGHWREFFDDETGRSDELFMGDDSSETYRMRITNGLGRIAQDVQVKLIAIESKTSIGNMAGVVPVPLRRQHGDSSRFELLPGEHVFVDLISYGGDDRVVTIPHGIENAEDTLGTFGSPDATLTFEVTGRNIVPIIRKMRVYLAGKNDEDYRLKCEVVS